MVVPAPAVPDAAEAGLPRGRLVAARPGEPIAAGDVTVHPVPALHGVHVADAYTHGLPGDGDQVRYLGYVVETPDGRLYHAGDTLRWDGQAELLRRHRVEVALLPINGRDAQREAQDIVGNLDAGEALALARDAGVGTVVPMHYDLMEGNLGDVEEFARLAPELHPDGRVAVLGPHGRDAAGVAGRGLSPAVRPARGGAGRRSWSAPPATSAPPAPPRAPAARRR